MPTTTFFRLAESKQQRIIEAIKHEVARVPYEEISINHIISECGISRGSFYQYFENKEDMYLYLIAGYHEQIFEYAHKTLNEKQGDFFAMLDLTFRFAVRMLCYKESRSFRKNLFGNMKMYEMLLQRSDYSAEAQERFDQIVGGIDLSLLTVSTREELLDLIGICVPAVLRDLACVFVKDEDEQTICRKFESKFELLKGAYSSSKSPASEDSHEE